MFRYTLRPATRRHPIETRTQCHVAARRCRPALERLEDRSVPSTFTVVNTLDGGPGSLRQAILDANAAPGADLIDFNIPGDGVHTISPTSALPGITGPVTIDGYTQPGASPNTLAVGNNAVLLIELTGSSAGQVDGLRLFGGNSTVRGLVINRFQADGIEIQSRANVIEGNFIGTDPTGTLNRGNGTVQGEGIFIRPVSGQPAGWEHSADGNRIGGPTPDARNVITGSGGGHARLFITVSSNNVIQGNYIGTNAAGTASLAGGAMRGVWITTGNGDAGNGPADGNLIGGTAPGAGNLISGNGFQGISLTGSSFVTTNTVIQGNYIGTDAAGTAAVPNGLGGIELGVTGAGAAGTLIGGTAAGARNIISGNGVGGAGIQIGNGEAATTGNIVQGNYVGTDVTGTFAVPNGQFGIEVKSPGNVIGGTAPGARNIISGNQNTGVHVRNVGSGTIQGNYIGTDVTGMVAVPNGTRENTGGVTLSIGRNVLVGGTSIEARNVISGNRGIGVWFDATGSNNVLQGNFIGVNAAGNPLGNTSAGVHVNYYAQSGLDRSLIGGSVAGAGNTIAHNGGNGVSVVNGWEETIENNSIYSNAGDGIFVGGGFSPNNNRITRNSIYSNGRLGINLYEYFDPADGVSANDPGDDDDVGSYGYAGNRLQNYPVLASAGSSGGNTAIIGSLNSSANTAFRIEFFANATIDPTGYGEGETYLGFTDVTTDGGGDAVITVNLAATVPAGHFVTATATDPTGNTSEFSFNRIVTQANRAPVASDDAYSVSEDTPLTVSAAGVLGNDSDADGDPITALLVSGPAHGTLTLNANGFFGYTPAANYYGSDSFTYKANDGALDSNIATARLTITAVNDLPIANPEWFTLAEDSSLVIPATGILANDTDFDGDPLSALLVRGPAHGSLMLNLDGSFRYTPDANFNGTDHFIYKANDGLADSNEAMVNLIVTPVNDPPVALIDGYSMDQGGTLAVAAPGVLANDSDVEGSALTAVLVTGPSHGTLTLNADGSFTYTPAATFSGTDTFAYKAFDGELYSNPTTVTIVVNPVNLGTPGKITGGGSIDERVRNFGFVVQTKVRDGVMSYTGNLEYHDKARGYNLHSTSITLIIIDPDGVHGMFQGTATLNGIAGYTFTVWVEDNGEPGSLVDRFRIQISGPGGFAYDCNDFATRGGLLDRGGNIQVHRTN